MQMNTAYVVESLRTPFGSFGGSLAELDAPHLGAAVMKALVERARLDPVVMDEVIVGQVLTGGVGQAPARQAMRYAGFPDGVHALTINKMCASGLKAIMLGAGSIVLGESQVVIAGGMESMSQAPYILARARNGYRMGNGEILDLMLRDGLHDAYSGQPMGEIADLRAERHELSRETQDAFAIRSYELAQKAVKQGVLKDEIVPVKRNGKNGQDTVSADEEPFKTDFEKLKRLHPVFREAGTITAANASKISDGAALTLLAGEAALKKYDLKPHARLVASATSSLSPDLFPDAPVDAIQAACDRAGIKLADIDLFEINEAFAVVPLIAAKQLDLNLERVNVNGGAVALGHPIGASGGRLVATLVREMQRRDVRYGLATLCIGGGEAVAAIFERV
jgi:acetyl-CoA C-acetyltransferase